jgi:Ca-activated chloride channel homolog
LLLPLLLLAACASRRGWLLVLPLLFMLPPQTSYAFEFDDLWLRPDQQGMRLLEAQRPAEAAQHFEDPQWQGKALFEAGDYAAAAERFAQGDAARDHYNRGNALAKAGELEAALDAYDQALERQPDLAAAQHNKALVEQALRQRQASQSNAPQGQQNPPQSPSQGQSQPTPGGQDEPKSDTQSEPSNADASPDNGSEKQEADTPQGKSDQPSDSEPAEKQGPARQLSEAELDTAQERRQATEQWLRQIPDDPGELLRRKFWYEQQQRQERPR